VQFKQEKAFSPITIVLDTEAEASALAAILAGIVMGSSSGATSMMDLYRMLNVAAPNWRNEFSYTYKDGAHRLVKR